MKGHVRERGTGNWYAVIDTRDPLTGARKRKWVSLPAATGKRQAQIECARLIAEAQNGGLSLEPAKTTLSEYLERWLEYAKPNVSPRSHERYAEIVRKNLGPRLGAIKLARLRPEQIAAAYTDALTRGRRDGKGGLSPRSVHHMHRILKQALTRAVRWQLIPRNPAEAVDPPKVERKELSTYDLPATAKAIEALRGTRMLVPTVLAVLCGLRRGRNRRLTVAER